MLQPQLPILPPFRNEGLFTDHYLADVLPQTRALWTLDGMDTARAELVALWEAEAPKVAGYNEAQLEEHFIRPVLRALGQVFEVQTAASSRQPDYGFFADEAARDGAKIADPTGGRSYWSRALAVGDAKSWERKLDKATGTDAAWGFANPSFQVGQYYLAETGCRWALLTNGRHWRLYSGDPKPNMQVFYEVDLPALLEGQDPDALAYFWLFFRRQAFLRDPAGKCFLDRVRAESDLAAERLRENVQEGVYKALLETCRGFVGHSPNQLTDADLGAVHDNALVFLYRLLFVLYAEAGDLLPVRDNPQYRDQYSLHAIKQQVATAGQDALPEGVVTLWPRLKALCAVVDRGHPGMGVPAYNGGLFDPEKHPFLDRHEMADRQAARVVDLLARTPEGKFVDYRDLGVRHLGSIYEGLLEYKLARATEPMVVVRQDGKERWVPASGQGQLGVDPEALQAGELYLVTDKGERKTSGSYYTPQFIVEYLVENTIGPLAAACETPEQVLELKVLDPAMGSGHFLVEATDFLARKLLEQGAAATLPEAQATEEADLAALKRVVVERCIFGVDLNPLAVELAKLSLWLDTVAKGQPLSFLDHHLRCGNSLIGAWWRAAAGGDPPNPEGKKRKPTADGTGALFDVQALVHDRQEVVARLGQLTGPASDSRAAVKAKGVAFEALELQIAERLRPMYDLWTSAYFGNTMTAVEYGDARKLLRGEVPLDADASRAFVAKARALAGEWRFFHWELAFPDVFFDADGQDREGAGFDAVIGNPPWERIKLQENEFFALRAPEVALAPTAAKRKALVARLPEANPSLWAEYQQAKRRAELELAWTRTSGQYPFMGRGDTNLYAVMTERGRSLLAPRGREGLVVPSGIATDSTTSAFFGDLVDRRSLQTLLDFENREGHFADVHRSFKYSVIILTGGAPQETFDCGFFLHNLEDLQDPERVFTLRPEDCSLMNPNTHTCPVFRTGADAALTSAVYQRVPVLVRETADGEENPWGVRYATMFHMTNDSALFRTARELEAEGLYPVAGNAWQKGQEVCLPLYEGKMVQMYDHRAASVKVNPANVHRPASPEETTDAQHADPAFAVTPQFWVSGAAVAQRLEKRTEQWLLAFKEITAPTNSRTWIGTLIPRAACSNKLPLLLPTAPQFAPHAALLVANTNAFAFDYVTRQKVGGQTLNWFLVKQFPVLSPTRYEDDFGGVRLADFVAERVLELTYTANDMAGFAEDLGHLDEAGHVKPPFPWDEERRLHLRCQLDALYFHLYGMTRDEAAYVLDTFPIVARRDREQFGKYRTKELILHYWSAYNAGDMGAWVAG